MKVVHVSKLPDGGATWCAMRICHALQKEGIESTMLLMQGEASDDIEIAEPYWLYRRNDNIFIRLALKILKFVFRPRYEYYKWRRKQAEKTGDAFFTSPLTDYVSLANHPAIQAADIVHLHWVSDFVDYPTFFRKVGKPIVWTIHDENPGLGGFHYQTHLEQANATYKKLDKDYAVIKRKALVHGSRPHLVAISTMMKSYFEQNEILHNCPMTLIHNGVEGDDFKMLDKVEARDALDIPQDKKVFLFSSYKIEDKRKGLALLIEALENLNDSSVCLVCLGGYETIPIAKIEIMCAGLIHDKELLPQYYSAADFFVLSSFQEAFAQTPLEAMSCGTPVISFPCSGAADLIDEHNGVVCDDFTTTALEKGMRKAMSKIYMRDHIRKDVLNRFSYNQIAKQYIDLYKSLIS